MERKHYLCPYDDSIQCDVLDWWICDRCTYYMDPEFDKSVGCPGIPAEEDDDERGE